jgi:hypothetical protein
MKNKPGKKPAQALGAACITRVSCLAYSSTLKIETTCSPETSIDFQLTAMRYIPELSNTTDVKTLNSTYCNQFPMPSILGCVNIGGCTGFLFFFGMLFRFIFTANVGGKV